jgi:hypothetical protein
MTDLRRVARAWIIAGFSLLFVGTVVGTAVLISNDYLGEGNARADTQLFLQPVGALAALIAWGVLSQLTVADASDVRMFRRAFVALGVWMFASAFSEANFLWSEPRFNEFTSQLWIDLLGSVVAVVGFLVMARAVGVEPTPEGAD